VHLNSDVYENVDKIIEDAVKNGVKKMIVVGYDLETSLKAVEIASNFDFIYAAVGIHPSEVKKAKISDFKAIEKCLENSKVVAIGEIGLDYHWDKDNKEDQKKFFVEQIKLADQYKLPILIHSRDAAQDTYEILKENKKYYEKGIMHCFSYSLEMAQKFIDLNFKIAFGGALTFLNAKENKEIVKTVGLENLVIETDAPYLTPHPFRGITNEPKYIYLVVEEMAKLKGIEKEKVAMITYKNACDLFGVK
jgi:TatD DNase family protein